MLLLTSTSDKLQLVTSGTATMHVHASWLDNVSGAVTPGRTNTAAITTATTTDIVASPGASTQRNVQTLNIRHASGPSANTVTIKHTDGTNNLELFSYSMNPGEHLQYIDGEGFQVFDVQGAKKLSTMLGRFLRTSVLAGSGNFTTLTTTSAIFVRLVGGGGGGGGCTSVAAAASAAGGGGAGGYAEKTFSVTGGTVYAYVVGAGGAGASGAGGANGADSTLAVSVTVTAKGGTGAVVATALTTLSAYAGGLGGTISTNGDVNSSGQGGESGVTLIVATPIVASGNGGSSPFGAGGKGITAVGNGVNAIGFGGGGSGAATGASTVRTGGNGSNGTIVVDEYS